MTNGSAAARFTSQPEGHRYHTERNGTRRKRSFFILSSLPGGPKWVYIHENCLHQEKLKIHFLPFFAFFVKKAKKEEKGMSFTCQTTFLTSPKSNTIHFDK